MEHQTTNLGGRRSNLCGVKERPSAWEALAFIGGRTRDSKEQSGPRLERIVPCECRVESQGNWIKMARPKRVRIIADLASDWRQLDERIEAVTDEIETLAKSDDSCRRVMTIPGIGPIISSAMVAAIGSGAAFARERDFSAWIGLVPKQMSTGDRTILGRISKRGNGYLRMLFIQAAQVILLRPASWPKHGFGVWLVRAAQRLHPNVLVAALANKLARIAWTVLAQERSYEARVTKATA
jgi:transposase